MGNENDNSSSTIVENLNQNESKIMQLLKMKNEENCFDEIVSGLRQNEHEWDLSADELFLRYDEDDENFSTINELNDSGCITHQSCLDKIVKEIEQIKVVLINLETK